MLTAVVTIRQIVQINFPRPYDRSIKLGTLRNLFMWHLSLQSADVHVIVLIRHIGDWTEIKQAHRERMQSWLCG